VNAPVVPGRTTTQHDAQISGLKDDVARRRRQLRFTPLT
jgi:hypothetical protein